MSIDVCIDVFAGSGPWIWVPQDIVWLDDILLSTGGRGWSLCR